MLDKYHQKSIIIGIQFNKRDYANYIQSNKQLYKHIVECKSSRFNKGHHYGYNYYK